MKNLDITLVGPQGSGKTTTAESIAHGLGANPRITHIFLRGMLSSSRSLAETLRAERADVVIFDDGVVANANEQAIAVAGIELYRQTTGRKVCAIYCVLGQAIQLLNLEKLS